MWAWWGQPGRGSGPAIATGSHLDSVPDGGAFDGPLGIVSAFAAIGQLRAAGFRPDRPIGSPPSPRRRAAEFGVACLGSRLLTGAIDPAAARELHDGDGVRLADAMLAAGRDPALLGPDDELLAELGCYVELHVEQGSALDGLGAAIGVAEGIWPHGRWRFDFAGRADHAGTTRLADRRDPMLPYAATVQAARTAAAAHGALATFGKVTAEPGAANAISAAVHAWLDARAPDEAGLERLVGDIQTAAATAAAEHGVGLDLRRESFTALVAFSPALRDRLVRVLAAAGLDRARAADRSRARRRGARGPHPHGDAVRPQPDRRIALARRARGADRLRDRGRRRWPRCSPTWRADERAGAGTGYQAGLAGRARLVAAARPGPRRADRGRRRPHQRR